MSSKEMLRAARPQFPLTKIEVGEPGVDSEGNLKPYVEVFEGTVAGYFMGMQGMEREAAEAAATEHLSKMQAWHCHS